MMKALIALAVTFLPATSFAQDATVTFVNTEGNNIGSATLQKSGSGVLIRAEVGGLPADSWVAFHIHEAGHCDPATKHDSAGGHFNPSNVEHGYLSKTGPHAGDMPNQRVDSGGFARFDVLNPQVALSEGETNIIGRALMIHAQADDYLTQPTGDAGQRLACAVIK